MDMNDFFFGSTASHEPTYMQAHRYQLSHAAPYYAADTSELSLPYSSSRSDYYSDSINGMHVVELLVPMCCTKCEEKVKEQLMAVEGVYQVFCDYRSQRGSLVTVTGYADPQRVLKKARKVKKGSELIWSRGAACTANSYNSRSSSHAATGAADDPNFPKYNENLLNSVDDDQYEISDNTVYRVSCTQKVSSNNHKQHFFRPIYEEAVSFHQGMSSTHLQHYLNYN
jgi:copper chaperone CopZ